MQCDRCELHDEHLCLPRVDRVRTLIEKGCVHTKGRWTRQPFVLSDWQRDEIVVPLFGMVEFSEEWQSFIRRYRIAWLELARKNGKTEFLAAVALYLLLSDFEQGAEIIGVARNVPQARKVYDVAVRMLQLSTFLRPLLDSGRVRIVDYQKRIYDDLTGSYYEVKAADADSALGENVHGVIFDEVLTQPNAKLWDALRTSFGAREQPLIIAATTAGNDPVGFCGSEHIYCERVRQNPSIDKRRFVFMRNGNPNADPFNEDEWRKVNPALGDFLSIETLRDEAREAKLSPNKLLAFKQFRLNIWVQQHNRWDILAKWLACAGSVHAIDMAEAMRGRTCYGGLDLASTTDLAALAWDFPDGSNGHDALYRVWIPRARVPELDDRTAGAASTWIEQGLLTATEGDVIDYAWIRAQIDEDRERFDVMELAYDRWGATQLSIELQDSGLVVVPFGQGFRDMSPPTKELERLVVGSNAQTSLYRHGANPIMEWMIGNTVLRRDPAGNVKPDKERSSDKIDGVPAAIMALDRATRQATKKVLSGYASF